MFGDCRSRHLVKVRGTLYLLLDDAGSAAGPALGVRASKLRALRQSLL